MLSSRQSSVPFMAAVLAMAVVGLGFGSAAQAQVRVEGEAVDGLTGLPVRGVIVQFPDLGLATLTDSLGYFQFDAVPLGTQILATYHMSYEDLAGEAPVTPGEVFVLKLTPRPIELSGVEVEVEAREETEARTMGRAADYISREEVEELAGRTNKVLEVIRAKSPPRLQIRQEGGVGGLKFCIQSTRQRPSVQELRDLGTGCKPALLVLDGVVVYSPPRDGVYAGLEGPSLPSDVAFMLLNQDPNEIESIRILTSTDAFFRYGEDGRLGAVEIKTKRPFKVR